MKTNQKMPKRPAAKNAEGSSLLIVLATVAVLALAAAQMLRMSDSRFRGAAQTGGWERAIYSAESGVDLAIATLGQKDWQTSPLGWTDGNGASITGPPPVASPSPTNADIRTFKTLLNAPAGQPREALIVKVDAPAGLRDENGQWYRVRSTGVVELPGQTTMGYEPGLSFENGTHQDPAKKLRRFAFNTDASQSLLAGRGQAVRTVEVLVKPNSPFVRPFTLRNKITMSGGGWVDSFDSTDPTKSTNGLYDVAKRQSHGDIGSVNSTGSNLSNTYVWGNLQYSGPGVSNTTNVQGTITTPFSETINPVYAPSWTTMNATPTAITNTMTLTGGPENAPARYKVSELTVPGGKVLTLAPHAAGQESYVEIWVTGKMTTSGSGLITQQPGVHVTYYVADDITVSGSSFNNQSNVASNMKIYGISPASGTKKITVSGSGNFIGVVNAPDFDFTISGQANLSGSFIGNTVNISGGASIHYDEALTKMGGVGPYSVASWAEDVR